MLYNTQVSTVLRLKTDINVRSSEHHGDTILGFTLSSVLLGKRQIDPVHCHRSNDGACKGAYAWSDKVQVGDTLRASK